MEKKISVTMKDDEVVSIEVDGMQYTHPDEIPDPEDREKVNALLSKQANDDTDSAFDQEEFDREFEEMGRETSKLPMLLIAIFLSIGVILLAVAAFSTIQSFRKMAKEQAAPGQVVDLVERMSYDSETKQTNAYYYPVVEFKPNGGSLERVQLDEGSWPPEYRAGDAVTILYDPERPQDARIKSISSAVLLWILPAITGTVGVVFVAVALIVFRVNRSQNSEQK